MEQEVQDQKAAPRHRFGLMAVALFAVTGLAACSSTALTGSGSGAPVVSTETNAMFGSILESGGRALYTLEPSSTPCDAACTQIWPELLLPSGTTKAMAGTGVSASSLGTIDRGHGTLQVTYGGKPLYFFAQDTAPGQVSGNITDTWGKWSVVVIAAPAANSGAGTTPPSTSSPAMSPPPAGTSAPATTAPAAPTTTARPAPTTTAPPAPTTTAPGGSGGAGF